MFLEQKVLLLQTINRDLHARVVVLEGKIAQFATFCEAMQRVFAPPVVAPAPEPAAAEPASDDSVTDLPSFLGEVQPAEQAADRAAAGPQDENAPPAAPAQEEEDDDPRAEGQHDGRDVGPGDAGAGSVGGDSPNDAGVAEPDAGRVRAEEAAAGPPWEGDGGRAVGEPPQDAVEVPDALPPPHPPVDQGERPAARVRPAARPAPATPVVPAARVRRDAGPIALKPTAPAKAKAEPPQKHRLPQIEKHAATGATINADTGRITGPDGRTSQVSLTAARYLLQLARGPATAAFLRGLAGREHPVDMVEMLLAKAKADMRAAGVTLAHPGGIYQIVTT